MAWLDNLLGLNDPSQASQMGLAAGLLGASGPSTRPVSLGQAISAGLLGARQAGMDTQQSMRRDQLVQAQISELMAQAHQRLQEKKQNKYLPLGGGAYMDAESGTIHQAPHAPKEENTPAPLLILKAMGVDPQSPQGSEILKTYLSRPQQPPNFTFMPTGPEGSIYGFNPRNPAAPVPTGLTAPPKTGSANPNFRDTQALRKEFEGREEVKAYRSALPVFQSIANTPSTPAGDLNYIYGVGKILDPNSVVREGEMKLVIQSGSPLQRILGTGSWLVGQNRLTDSQRAELAALMRQRMGALQSQYDSAATEFSSLSERLGFSPQDVILNRGNNMAAPSQPQGEFSIRKLP